MGQLDALLIELGSGGDLKLDGNDISVTLGLENQPYIAQFSGDGKYWGNDLIAQQTNNPAAQFSSTTETVMREYALNSNGKAKIEQAMLADLQYLITLDPDTKISVTSQIVSANRLDVQININGKTFYYQWHPNSGFLKYSI